MPFCIIVGLLAERLGRKKTLLLFCIPQAAGFTVLLLSKNVPAILVGRAISGVTNGIGSIPSIYVAETCEPKYRGPLLASLPLGLSLGCLLVHIWGTFFTWQTTAAISVSLPVLGFILIWFYPESPAWLAKTGRLEEAEKSFKYCRSRSDGAVEEMRAMLGQRKLQEEQLKLSDYLTKKEFVKPLLITLLIVVVVQFSGMQTLVFYSVTIMKSTLGSDLNEYLATVVVDIVRCVSSVLAVIGMKKYKRKTLLLAGGIGISTSLFLLTAFLYISKSFPQLTNYSFVPLLLLVSFMFFMYGTFVPFFSCLLAEVFQLRLRAFASSISFSVYFGALFVVIKISPAMFSSLGMTGTFLVNGLVALFGSLVIYVLTPETKGKSLAEVETFFKGKDYAMGEEREANKEDLCRESLNK